MPRRPWVMRYRHGSVDYFWFVVGAILLAIVALSGCEDYPYRADQQIIRDKAREAYCNCMETRVPANACASAASNQDFRVGNRTRLQIWEALLNTQCDLP